MGNQYMDTNFYLGQPCKRCSRTLVRGRSKAAERQPGEVAYKAKGYCRMCYRALFALPPRVPRENDIVACTDCDKLLQKRYTTRLKGFTVVRIMNPPLCTSCVHVRRKSATLISTNQHA